MTDGFLLAAPVVLPLLGAAISVLVGRSRAMQRVISLSVLTAVAALAAVLLVRVDQDGTTLVSALDPELLVSIPGRPELAPIAAEAKTRLQTALATIAAASTAS